jgi:Peptidase family S41
MNMKITWVRHLNFLLLCCLWALPIAPEETQLPRAALIEDARQLLAAIESAHPDPYTSGGGKIAFHRRFHEVLATIPLAGMKLPEFYRLLLPFVASVGDGHTAIRLPQSNPSTPTGLPLSFGIVEESMVVQNEISLDGESLLGGRLTSLERVGFADLLKRQNRLRGIENIYGTLALLCRSLGTREILGALLPEWNGRDRLTCELLLPDGHRREFRIPLDAQAVPRADFPKSRVTMPDLEHSDVAYCFLDRNKETAILAIKDMMAYREGCEGWLADGLSEAAEFIGAAYARFHPGDPPKDPRKALEAIPSATETFRDLVLDMKEAKTRNLIVDLRGNGGGNGFMCLMLLYFLYGDRAIRGYDEGYSISRYSDLYFHNYTTSSLEEINKGRAVPLEKGDFDFVEEERYRMGQGIEEIESFLAKSPTFMAVYRSGQFNGIYAPPTVVVLCSPSTYSSGFNLMTALSKNGALTVGTPSAQPGNNFGDSLILQLKNTGIQAFVAFKRIVAFPDDPDKGRFLPVDHLLTYSKLASYGFDPNAEVLLALDIVASGIHKTPFGHAE